MRPESSGASTPVSTGCSSSRGGGRRTHWSRSVGLPRSSSGPDPFPRPPSDDHVKGGAVGLAAVIGCPASGAPAVGWVHRSPGVGGGAGTIRRRGCRRRSGSTGRNGSPGGRGLERSIAVVWEANVVYALALMATLANAVTSILQRMGVEDAPEDSTLKLRLMTHALRRGIWLIGFAVMVGSFLCQAVALH